MMKTTKTGVLPDEDMGSVMVNVTAAPGSSLARTTDIMAELGAKLDSIPEISIYPKSVIRLWGDCPLVSCSMLLA